jgi:hypothetical protein
MFHKSRKLFDPSETMSFSGKTVKIMLLDRFAIRLVVVLSLFTGYFLFSFPQLGCVLIFFMFSDCYTWVTVLWVSITSPWKVATSPSSLVFLLIQVA